MDNCHFVHQKVRLWLLKQKFAFFHKRELANSNLMIIFSKKIKSRLKVYFSSWAKLWFGGYRNVARLLMIQGFVWKVSGGWENRCTVRYLFIFQILVKWHVSNFSFGKSFNFGVQNAFWKFLRFWGIRNILSSNISQGNFLRVPGVWEILCTVRYLSATRKKETINQICSQNKAECWTHYHPPSIRGSLPMDLGQIPKIFLRPSAAKSQFFSPCRANWYKNWIFTKISPLPGHLT